MDKIGNEVSSCTLSIISKTITDRTLVSSYKVVEVYGNLVEPNQISESWKSCQIFFFLRMTDRTLIPHVSAYAYAEFDDIPDGLRK